MALVTGPSHIRRLFRPASNIMATLPQDRLTIPPAADLTARVAALEARCAALEAVLKVDSTGSVHIKAASSISLEAGAGIMCKSGTTMDMMGGTTVYIKAFSGMNVQSSGQLVFKGSTISIN